VTNDDLRISIDFIIILLKTSLSIPTIRFTATVYYKNIAFSLWERLPAANTALAAYCQGLSRLRAVPKKMTA
jgi:hypothetical protein